MCPDPYVWEFFVDVSTGTGSHNSAFCLVVVLCNGLSVAKRGFFGEE